MTTTGNGAGKGAAPDAPSEAFVVPSLGDIRGPLERLGRLMSTLAAFCLLVFAVAVIAVAVSGHVESASRQVDFVALWAAGKLALAGDATAAFDQRILREAQNLPSDASPGELFWLYPPGVQFLIAPLAVLPFWVAWLAFALLSITAFAASCWRWAMPVPMGRNLLVGAPIVVMTLVIGQVSLLWASALFAALRALDRNAPAMAGLLIGVLTLKPQLGMLIPVALIAAGRWRVVFWACAGMALVQGLPTVVVGPEYWSRLFEQLGAVTFGYARDTMPHHLMVSPYAFGRMAGLSHHPALGLQAVVSLALAALIAVLWSGRRFSPDFRYGVLLLAIPMATPYAFYYELALTVPAMICLARAGYARRTLDRTLLALLIVGPLALYPGAMPFPLLAPLVAAILLRALIVGWRAPENAQGPQYSALR